MPSPIRPASGIGGLFSLPVDVEMEGTTEQYDGPIPGQYSQQKTTEDKIKFRKASESDRKLLYSIWENGQKMTAQAQVALGKREEDIVYHIPDGISSFDANRLERNGYLVISGNNTVKFTMAGRMALSKEIMSQPHTME